MVMCVSEKLIASNCSQSSHSIFKCKPGLFWFGHRSYQWIPPNALFPIVFSQQWHDPGQVIHSDVINLTCATMGFVMSMLNLALVFVLRKACSSPWSPIPIAINKVQAPTSLLSRLKKFSRKDITFILCHGTQHRIVWMTYNLII
jgi:hypothetical protein